MVNIYIPDDTLQQYVRASGGDVKEAKQEMRRVVEEHAPVAGASDD